MIDICKLEDLRESANDWLSREEYLVECEIAMPALLAELKAARSLFSAMKDTGEPQI